jgi:hypothetical protein
VVGRLEVNDLETELLHAEVLLCAEHEREGDPTQGVGHLVGQNGEEGLVTIRVSLLKSKSMFLKVLTKMMGSTICGYESGSGM